MSSPSVLVTHPGRQHSHQLALGLHGAGLLAEYWTGVPAKRKGPASHLLDRLSKYELLPLPEERVRHCFIAPLARKFFGAVLPAPQAVDWSHRAAAWFDRWCAHRLSEVRADAVVCYENAALETFRRAKALGLTTILDAASFHHAWQDRFYDYVEPDDVHARITRRKDEEIALADHVLTVSELARESYLDAGMPTERVTAVPMGCDLDRFTAGADEPGAEAPFTFIFAGYADQRKGIDVLLKASEILQHEGLLHRLRLAGDTSPSIDWASYPWVDRRERVPQHELVELFRQSDCFVLPSRFDSFGMVVVEAMATGLPAIVSDHVGAKEAVEEGKTGWIVPAEDPDALAERMRWCLNHREALASYRRRARKAAEDYSWKAYHGRVTQVIDDVLHTRAPAAVST